MANAGTGSLHDPHGRVVDDGERILRLLDADGLAEYEAYAAAAREHAPDGVVGTTRLDAVPSAFGDGTWAGALEHERVPVISYASEWTFSMLQDAALLHLDLLDWSLDHGLLTKDATPYNVQFDGARPVFIDVGSFHPIHPGEPWFGYRQFCQLFLNPLVLQGRTGVAFQPWLQGTVEGIAPSDLARLLPRRDRLRPSLFPHVTAHAWADRRATSTRSGNDVGQEMKRAGFGPAILRSQVKSLRKAVRSLRWKLGESTWSDYSERGHYTDADLRAKEDLVVAVAARTPRRQVLDIGANDGRFSLAVRPHADVVVAVDLDATVIERLYRELRTSGTTGVLPLVADVADMNGGMGWAGRQRGRLLDRVRPDLVLALAVVHHLTISRSIPLASVVAMLADLGAELVVEFPHRDDPMVVRLLAQKQAGSVQPYDLDLFRSALTERFEVLATETLPSGTRTVFHAAPRS